MDEDFNKRLDLTVARIGLDVEIPLYTTDRGDWSDAPKNLISGEYHLNKHFPNRL
jgi:hypothetical protein